MELTVSWDMGDEEQAESWRTSKWRWAKGQKLAAVKPWRWEGGTCAQAGSSVWPHTREPARHARQWEQVVNFMLESDVVRFVLYDSARWKQWGNRSRRQATEEQKIIILPVGDGCRPAGGTEEDHQQGWEATSGRGRSRSLQVRVRAGKEKVRLGVPESVMDTNQTEKLGLHRKAFSNFLAAIFLVAWQETMINLTVHCRHW